MVLAAALLTMVLVVLLCLANPGALMPRDIAVKSKNLTSFDSSCNVTVEDKRGVPTGANPLHHR